MAGFQWVVLLSMLAVASSCHIPVKSCSCKKGGIGGIIGGGVIGGVGVKLPIAIPIVKGPIVVKGHGRGFINLGIFVGGLSSIVRSAIDIINEVIAWKINTIFDVFHIIISLSRSCGIIIDVFISGLGTLFGNLVIAIYKILVCVIGLPKIGGIIGSRDICRDDYGCKYGWRRYSGKYISHIDILKHYGVYNARAQCRNILNTWTKGGDINKLDYSSRIVYEHVLRLAELVERDYKTWCQNDFSEVYFSVTLILGVFANRCRSGLGLKFVDETQEIFSEYFQSQNIDITSSSIRIKKSLEIIEESQWSGVFISTKETSVRQIESDKQDRETNIRREKSEQDSSKTERRESESNERESSNRSKQETEVSKSEQSSGQKSETSVKENSSENDSSNTSNDYNKSESESKGSKSGGISVEKYKSNTEIEDNSIKKASADSKSNSNASTNTETVDNNSGTRSKSSSSTQTSQESSVNVSEEKKLKVSKEVTAEKVDVAY